MKDTIFYHAFYFTEYSYDRYHHTDAGDGASHHYIGLLEEGSCRIVSDRITIEVSAGEPFYIPMHLPYQSYWFSEGRIRLRSYGFDFFPENRHRNFCLQKLPTASAEKIRQIPLSHEPDSAALSALFGVLGELLPRMSFWNPESAERLREKVTECLLLHPEWRMPEVARSCGVSESTLYAAFRKTGTTPNLVRQEAMVREAKRLLTTTDLPVQEISDKVGCSSASYFRKVLYAHTGMTPSRIRKSGIQV